MRDYAGPAVEVGGELEVMGKWLEEETSAPLVVLGGKEAGKKTLLCAFLRQSKQRHPNWLHLSHFATITPHYAHILYKTMIALRVIIPLRRTTTACSSESTSIRKNSGGISSIGWN